MSSMVLSPCGSSFSLLVAQPPSRVAASSPAAASIQIRGLGFSGAVVDPTPLGAVVDVARLLQMHGHPGAGLHVERREDLAGAMVDLQTLDEDKRWNVCDNMGVETRM